MEQFEGRRSGMLNTGVWCNPVNNIKGVEWGFCTRGLFSSDTLLPPKLVSGNPYFLKTSKKPYRVNPT